MSISASIGIVTENLLGIVTDSQERRFRYNYRIMKRQMQPFSDLIEQRLLELNSNAFAVEQAAGLPADAIRNVIRSKTKDGPTISRAREICDALGLDFYIGHKRTSPGFAEGDGTGGFARTDASKAGFLPIPWHPEARMQGSAPVGFSQPWLAAEELIPDFLQAVVPDICQLSFTVAKNTVAVIQTNAPQKGSGSIWCFKDGETIGIAKAVFIDGFTILLPNNDAEDAKSWAKNSEPSTRMLGKVVWLGMLT